MNFSLMSSIVLCHLHSMLLTMQRLSSDFSKDLDSVGTTNSSITSKISSCTLSSSTIVKRVSLGYWNKSRYSKISLSLMLPEICSISSTVTFPLLTTNTFSLTYSPKTLSKPSQFLKKFLNHFKSSKFPKTSSFKKSPNQKSP